MGLAILLLWINFIVKFLSSFMYLSGIWIFFSIGILLILILVLPHSFLGKLVLYINKIPIKHLFTTLFLLSIFPKLICVILFHIDSRNHIDIYIYQNVAKQIAQNGIVTKYADYYNSFPHQLWFSLFLSGFVKIFDESQMLFAILQSVMLSLSTVFLFPVFMHHTSKAKAFVALLAYNLMPSTIFLPLFITHEIAFLFLLSISVYLYDIMNDWRYMKKNKCHKFGLLLIFTATLFFATEINPGGLVVCIAFILQILVLQVPKKTTSRKRKICKCVPFFLILILFIPATNLLKQRLLDSRELSSINISRVEWTLFVGSNVDSNGGYSHEDAVSFGWNPNDCNTYEEQGRSDEQVVNLRHSLLLNRYRVLFNQPIKALKLLCIKLGKILSYPKYPISEIPSLIKEPHKWFFENIFVQICATFEIITGSIFAAFAIKNSNHQNCGLYQFSILYITGCTILFLISECNSKYTIPFQPFLWMVMTMKVSKCSMFRVCPPQAAK